ncbi:MAG: M64 family metallopeptidase [Planctomycetota bacterium]|jgi:hypothetical protein|nr:M64 family metallopeptidase [Planctomycetota bacterium]
MASCFPPLIWLILSCAQGPQPLSDPTPQATLLERAEARAGEGHYADAATLYGRLARDHPDTPEGRTAARRSQSSAYLGSAAIVENGPGENRVDVALMGDGYQLREMRGFDKLAEDIPPLFERQATLREYYTYFNFRRLALVSADNGVDGFGREYDTALDGRTLGTYAGHVGVSAERVRAMLDEWGEHDSLAIVFVKQGVLGTGGGGFATIGGRNAKTTIHEWGHAFAELGDEYATKTHERGGVSRRVNVSDTDDPEEVPWAHWIKAGVRGIGVYEGASGQVRGAWKPTSGGCVMESGEFFCPPCREALVLRIYSIVDPIESCSPLPHPRRHAVQLVLDDPLEFEVEVMRPENHRLEVRWWVIPERGAPMEPEERLQRYRNRHTDRRGRGPLAMIPLDPAATSRGQRSGRHRFRLERGDLESGRYRVLCRARDRTLLRGERTPWVLEDPDDLLVSQRAWWVVVPEAR